MSNVMAFAILSIDFAVARTGMYMVGVIYQFRAIANTPGIVNRIYTGMSQAFEKRRAAHIAANRVAAWISDIEILVTHRMQLRALEQVRLLAVRINGGKASAENTINAMTRHNWEKVGAELVRRWRMRQAASGASPSMQALLDDVDQVMAKAFQELSGHF